MTTLRLLRWIVLLITCVTLLIPAALLWVLVMAATVAVRILAVLMEDAIDFLGRLILWAEEHT